MPRSVYGVKGFEEGSDEFLYSEPSWAFSKKEMKGGERKEGYISGKTMGWKAERFLQRRENPGLVGNVVKGTGWEKPSASWPAERACGDRWEQVGGKNPNLLVRRGGRWGQMRAGSGKKPNLLVRRGGRWGQMGAGRWQNA